MKRTQGQCIAWLAWALAISLWGCAEQIEQQAPLADGTYRFQHKYAEQPTMDSFALTAEIQGRHARFIKNEPGDVFPQGLFAEGELFWHEESGQWILATEDADRMATEVGGCSGGPDALDLKKKIYWTC
ncbi:hypothetical protein [Alcanivorax sp.]|uniref:hypothetical protein n=1 Tax=Alcanivorax sp. TaxID=1872427 RepID=UPI003A900DF5